MLDKSNEILSPSGNYFSHCVLLQYIVGNGENAENEMCCFKNDSWGSVDNESGSKCMIWAVGIEVWKPNVICSIIQRTNNEKHSSENWDVDTDRIDVWLFVSVFWKGVQLFLNSFKLATVYKISAYTPEYSQSLQTWLLQTTVPSNHSLLRSQSPDYWLHLSGLSIAFSVR